MADENRLKNLRKDEDKMGGLMPVLFWRNMGAY
jgi:hypothetical protein